MIGTVNRARMAAGAKSYPVLFLAGNYGFACKVLGAVGDKIAVVLLHDDGASSHYKRAVDFAQLCATRESAQESWRAGREERKAARLAKRAARAEYRAAVESDKVNRRNQERAARADKRELAIA